MKTRCTAAALALLAGCTTDRVTLLDNEEGEAQFAIADITRPGRERVLDTQMSELRLGRSSRARPVREVRPEDAELMRRLPPGPAHFTLFFPTNDARISPAQIESFANQAPGSQESDPALRQAQQLIEGDWVDFDPPYEGLPTARVAWVGVRGYLLFCDSEGEQRFSLDCEGLAIEIRAGRARIPEQSLTRNAMLRLKDSLAAGSS